MLGKSTRPIRPQHAPPSYPRWWCTGSVNCQQQLSWNGPGAPVCATIWCVHAPGAVRLRGLRTQRGSFLAHAWPVLLHLRRPECSAMQPAHTCVSCYAFVRSMHSWACACFCTCVCAHFCVCSLPWYAVVCQIFACASYPFALVTVRSFPRWFPVCACRLPTYLKGLLGCSDGDKGHVQAGPQSLPRSCCCVSGGLGDCLYGAGGALHRDDGIVWSSITRPIGVRSTRHRHTSRTSTTYKVNKANKANKAQAQTQIQTSYGPERINLEGRAKGGGLNSLLILVVPPFKSSEAGRTQQKFAWAARSSGLG